MVLRMYDHSARYDFSQSKTNSSIRTLPEATNNAANSIRNTTTSERSLWRDGDTPTNRRYNSSQRTSGFTVPPPYSPYLPTDEMAVATTPRVPIDSLELSAPSPMDERVRMYNAWFSRKRRRTHAVPRDAMVNTNSWHVVIIHFLAHLIPMVQVIAAFQTWWNQWLEFRLKVTAKRRIAQAILNLRAAWAWKEQHAIAVAAVNATDREDATSTTDSTSNWSLRDIVGDVGLALFSPLHEEAFIPLPESQSPVTAYVAPNALTSDPIDVVESRQEEEEQASKRDDNRRSPKTEELENKWEFVALEDEAAATSEEEEEDFEEDADRSYIMLEEYPVEVVPEDPSELEACPRIMTDALLQQLVDEGLPDELKMNKWQRVFAIGRDGDNFLTMVDYCSHFRYTLVAMKTTQGHVLGGFASERWNSPQGSSGGSYNNRRQSYYGTGQSFLFTNHPDVVAQQQEELRLCRRRRSRGNSLSQPPPPQQQPLVAIFKWTGANEYCQICDVDKGTLAMGGGGAFGLIVEEDFNRGVTSSCYTFGNPCLIPDHHDGRFEIESFEVYGLIPWLTESSISSSCGSSILISSSPPNPSPGLRSRSCSLY